MLEELPSAKKVQFIFGDKMVEFDVDWTQSQLTDMVTDVMKDDGYLWIPQDDEMGLGMFVNIGNCSAIKLVERKPVEQKSEQERATEIVEMSVRYLNHLRDDYGLKMFDGVFNNAPTEYISVMLADMFGISRKDGEMLLMRWREVNGASN